MTPSDKTCFVPEHILRMSPYSSARDEFPGERDHITFMDANELPYSLHRLPAGINRYPQSHTQRLKERLAAIKGVPAGRIFTGNGSDEIIDLLMRCFAQHGEDEIMVFPPVFSMYGNRAQANNLGVVEVPLDERFRIDAAQALARCGSKTRMLFVCHPNNPSGNLQDEQTIIRLLEGFDGLVIVDEAYIDFCPQKSVLPLLDQYPGLVVLQTFSKAFGLAGARVGIAYASEQILAVMEKVRCPYNLSTSSAELAVEALNSHAEFRLSTERIRHLRRQLVTALNDMPLVEEVYPSEANFLLVKTTDGPGLYRHLVSHGLVVRLRHGRSGCDGCLRITVGTAEENQRLLDAWRRYGEPGTPEAENRPARARESDPSEGRFAGVGQTESSPGEAQLPAAKSQGQADVPPRRHTASRSSLETSVVVHINLDGAAYSNISTGIGFFDHMLEQIARHGAVDLEVITEGDLHTDPHHTIEDTAITLGSALLEALGDKRGLERYGFALPMDDSRAMVLIDLGGRSHLEWDCPFNAPQIGGIPASLFRHFFGSLAASARCNIHVQASGDDDHHKIEAVFKAFARALRMALQRNQSGILPSTKGMF